MVNVILIVVGIFIIAAIFGAVSTKMKSATKKVAESETAKQTLEAKLASLRQEVSSLKEDNQRKSKSLEEVRETAKKKLRKDAQKLDAENNAPDFGTDETERLKRTLAAMESQIRTMRENAEQTIESVKADLEVAHAKELSRLNAEFEKVEAQLDYAKGESNKRRQNLSKQLATPVDLAEVPTEVVGELSRLMRKTEQYEKMHGILQGKHQLAQEKYQELQRRYFAVCRELALVALPNEVNTDESARRLAERVVEASDSLSNQKESDASHKQASDEPSTDANS